MMTSTPSNDVAVTMAFSWYILLTSIFIASPVLAANFFSNSDEIEGYPGYCSNSDRTMIFPVGALVHDTIKCWRYSCSQSKGSPKKYQVSVSTCGVLDVEPPCMIKQGKQGLPYPSCCPTVKCPDDSRNIIVEN